MSESGANRSGVGKPLAQNYQHHHNYTVQKVNAEGLANYHDTKNRNDIQLSAVRKPPFDKSVGLNKRGKLEVGSGLFRNRPFSSENKYGARAKYN